MSNIKNEQVKHLLSRTEEEVETLQQIVFNDLREATWSTTSVTDDMRRMNTTRLLQELRAQIERTARNSLQDNFSHRGMQTRVNDMLHHYRDMGSIRNFHIQSITETDETVTMNLQIVPTATVERITMEVRLTP